MCNNVTDTRKAGTGLTKFISYSMDQLESPDSVCYAYFDTNVCDLDIDPEHSIQGM